VTVHHVALECTRAAAQAEVDFWALLGFDEVEPPASLAARARWVQRGGTQIHVLYAEEPVVAREGHVAVVLEDYERVREALGAQPRTEHWGAPRTQARSPAGHLVELMAWPPSS